MNLVQHLRQCLSNSIRAWERFKDPSGDIAYFSDLDSPVKHIYIEEISENFEQLKDAEQIFIHLYEICYNFQCKV